MTTTVFLRARAIAFSCIAVISFVWSILLSLEIYFLWNNIEFLERSLIIVFLVTNVLTVVILPILMLLPFRSYLDGARLLLLLVAHIGAAAAFTYFNPSFPCHGQTDEQVAVCTLLNTYIVIASWSNPILLVAYSIGLAILIYHERRYPFVLPKARDEEAAVEAKSINSENYIEWAMTGKVRASNTRPSSVAHQSMSSTPTLNSPPIPPTPKLPAPVSTRYPEGRSRMSATQSPVSPRMSHQQRSSQYRESIRKLSTDSSDTRSTISANRRLPAFYYD